MMWKWKRSNDGNAAVAQPENGVADHRASMPVGEDGDEAIDAFVAVLRTLGQHAFDVEHLTALSFGELCEAWSRHILLGTKPPAGAATGLADDDDPDVPNAFHPRDWRGARRFVADHRRQEQAYVTEAMGDLRQGIWAFAQTLGTALVEDHRGDTRVQGQINRLKKAVDGASAEELKREVLDASSIISTLVSERQLRQQAQLEELGERISSLAGQLREVKHENVHDSLTQLVNRKGFDEFLSRVVFLRDVFGEQACMLLVDVDHFKLVNDAHGHQAGDAVLRALADCLVRNFPRKSDIVTRYGGEEFAILLPDTSLENGHRLAERLVGAIRALVVPHTGQSLTITASIGVARLARFESAQGWLERADKALYAAKDAGRDCVADAAEFDPYA